MKSARIYAALVAAALLVLPASAMARGPWGGPGPRGPRGMGGGGGPGPVHRALMEQLFPPELIMRYQTTIGLKEKQRAAITKAVEQTQSSMLKLKWQIAAGAEDLAKLLKAKRIDERKALAQVDKLMRMEHEFKRSHLALLIRIRNVLTPAQHAKLMKLRNDLPPGMDGPPGPPGPPGRRGPGRGRWGR